MDDISQYLDSRAGLMIWDQSWPNEPLMDNGPDPMLRGAAILKHQIDLYNQYIESLDSEEQTYWDSI